MEGQGLHVHLGSRVQDRRPAGLLRAWLRPNRLLRSRHREGREELDGAIDRPGEPLSLFGRSLACLATCVLGPVMLRNSARRWVSKGVRVWKRPYSKVTGAPKVKALSVRQPWAWAILHAGKDIE